jgi:hypothetical protein
MNENGNKQNYSWFFDTEPLLITFVDETSDREENRPATGDTPTALNIVNNADSGCKHVHGSDLLAESSRNFASYSRK